MKTLIEKLQDKEFQVSIEGLDEAQIVQMHSGYDGAGLVNALLKHLGLSKRAKQILGTKFEDQINNFNADKSIKNIVPFYTQLSDLLKEEIKDLNFTYHSAGEITLDVPESFIQMCEVQIQREEKLKAEAERRQAQELEEQASRELIDGMLAEDHSKDIEDRLARELIRSALPETLLTIILANWHLCDEQALKSTIEFKLKQTIKDLQRQKKEEVSNKVLGILKHFKGNDAEISEENKHRLQSGNFKKFFDWVFALPGAEALSADMPQYENGRLVLSAVAVVKAINSEINPPVIINPFNGFAEGDEESQLINPLLGVNSLNNLDDLFTEFNKGDEEGFENKIRSMISDPGKKDEIADKLFAVLNHFKGDYGKIPTETQEMLKNNSAFMRFIGWICSFLPEFILPKTAQDWVKRYEFSAASDVMFAPAA